MFKYFREQLYVRLRNLEIAKSIDSSRTRLSEPLQGIFGTVLDSQQFARVYIPLRRRVTASISVLRVLVHSNPTTPIVSRLRKAVLSRIIRLHGIIAYTRRGQRTPAAPLHLFRPTVFWSDRVRSMGRLIHSTEASGAWLEIYQILTRDTVCASSKCNLFLAWRFEFLACRYLLLVLSIHSIRSKKKK